MQTVKALPRTILKTTIPELKQHRSYPCGLTIAFAVRTNEWNIQTECHISDTTELFAHAHFKDVNHHDTKVTFLMGWLIYELSPSVTKPTNLPVRPAKIQISLGIRQV